MSKKQLKAIEKEEKQRAKEKAKAEKKARKKGIVLPPEPAPAPPPPRINTLTEYDKEGNPKIPAKDDQLEAWMSYRCPVPAQPRPHDFNFAAQYISDLGVHISVDGGNRISKKLPSATIISLAPPAAFYQTTPSKEDVAINVSCDMNSTLQTPEWLDDYKHFWGIPYDEALFAIIDVRTIDATYEVVDSVGWAALPIFTPGTRYTASGYYHLPLFEGAPSQEVLSELMKSAKGEVEASIRTMISDGRIAFTADHSSVYVRLLDGTRRGQISLSHQETKQGTRVPGYAHLDPKLMDRMAAPPSKGTTYASLRPKNMTDDQFLDRINEVFITATGLDEPDFAESDEDMEA